MRFPRSGRCRHGCWATGREGHGRQATPKKFSFPKKLTKGEKEIWGADAIIFNEDEELSKLWRYCRRDVIAEVGLSEYLDDLSPMEERIWRITQRMNARGITIDVELAKCALILAGKAKAKMNAELEELTGIEGPDRSAAVKAWLAKHEGFEISDTKSKDH